jgi:hypothetical protein
MSAIDVAVESALVLGEAQEGSLTDLMTYEAYNYYQVPLQKGGTGVCVIVNDKEVEESLNTALFAFSTMILHTSGPGTRDSRPVSVWGGQQP